MFLCLLLFLLLFLLVLVDILLSIFVVEEPGGSITLDSDNDAWMESFASIDNRFT